MTPFGVWTVPVYIPPRTAKISVLDYPPETRPPVDGSITIRNDSEFGMMVSLVIVRPSIVNNANEGSQGPGSGLEVGIGR